MDEVDSLEALANILNDLSENPYDLSIHYKHVALAQQNGMDDQLQVACDMLAGVWSSSDTFWFPIIEHCKTRQATNTGEGVQYVLDMYKRAEADYLCEPSAG
jgi:hypothetical protein